MARSKNKDDLSREYDPKTINNFKHRIARKLKKIAGIVNVYEKFKQQEESWKDAFGDDQEYYQQVMVEVNEEMYKSLFKTAMPTLYEYMQLDGVAKKERKALLKVMSYPVKELDELMHLRDNYIRSKNNFKHRIASKLEKNCWYF